MEKRSLFFSSEVAEKVVAAVAPGHLIGAYRIVREIGRVLTAVIDGGDITGLQPPYATKIALFLGRKLLAGPDVRPA